jgi:hypothetical protein
MHETPHPGMTDQYVLGWLLPIANALMNDVEISSEDQVMIGEDLYRIHKYLKIRLGEKGGDQEKGQFGLCV